MWCISKSPLIIGANLDTITNQSLAILKNENLIALNQDALGNQARCIKHCHHIYGIQLWTSYQTGNGEPYHAFIIVNFGDDQD